MAAADEGALSSGSRCYFSLTGSSGHDVAPFLRCGPILFPWSSPSAPWLTYELSGKPSSSGVKVLLDSSVRPNSSGLHRGEVLRRPDGAAAPKGSGGLALPVVPRQRAGWAGVLSAPPLGLRPAPVGDLIGDWGQTYRSGRVRSGQLLELAPRPCGASRRRRARGERLCHRAPLGWTSAGDVVVANEGPSTGGRRARPRPW